MGCFPVDFQEIKRPLRTKSVKRPTKVGKRPINEGKRPIKAKVLVGVSVGCLMGCFRAPPPWRKTAPLKRHIKRSMKHATSENGSCTAVFGMLRCRSCTATLAFLQCGCHFDQSCAAASEKLQCNIQKVAFRESGAFLPLSCGFQAPTFRHPRLGPADFPFTYCFRRFFWAPPLPESRGERICFRPSWNM